MAIGYECPHTEVCPIMAIGDVLLWQSARYVLLWQSVMSYYGNMSCPVMAIGYKCPHTEVCPIMAIDYVLVWQSARYVLLW